MKDGSGNWLIVNIIVNGVNLGLTFRNQFQALAIEHNGDIEEVTNNWISNADI
jgi:phospholipid transport system substrate-binding protein